MKTLKRLSLVSMFLVTLVVYLSQAGFTSEAAEPVYCYKYSAPALEATYNYLDEIYLKKYPEFGLTLHYGSPSDIQIIRDKAAEIARGCKTDEEKANAIVNWIMKNVEYNDESPNQFPIDVLIYKNANCAGFAHLMSNLMRAVGITAVPVSGYRGDMVSTVTEDYVKDLKNPGHQWVFAYIGNKWVMYDYDSLYTNFDVISKKYFVMGIEGVVPYYDEINFTICNRTTAVYLNGEFYAHTETDIATGNDSIDTTAGVWSAVNYDYIYMSRYKTMSENDWEYIKNPKRIKELQYGECFSDGWIGISGNAINYAQPTGVIFGNVFNKLNDKYVFNHSLIPTNDIDEYFLYRGSIVVYDGEYLPFISRDICSALTPANKARVKYEIYKNGEDGFGKIRIDDNGKITVLKEGFIRVDLYAANKDTRFAVSDHISFYATKSKERAKCEYNQHVYKTISSTKATTKKDGKTVKECVGCGKKKSLVIPKIKTVKFAKKTYCMDVSENYFLGGYVKPDAIVKDTKGETLHYGIDYTIKYKNNKKCGTATATVKFKGKYKGSKKLTFKITTENVLNLKTASITQNSVRLKWDMSSFASGYRIYMYDYSKKKYVKLTDVKATNKVPRFTVNDLTSGKKYKFAVKAYLKQGSKTYWSPDYISITVATDLKKPVISKVTSGKKQVTLKIDKVKYATGYVIYMSTSKNGEYKKVATTTKTKYTVKKLKKNKKYYFKVKAYRKINDKKYYSNRSKAVSVRTTK